MSFNFASLIGDIEAIIKIILSLQKTALGGDTKSGSAVDAAKKISAIRAAVEKQATAPTV